MILLCPPEKSTHFHYPLDPKKIRAEGSMHKDTTYQGSDRQDFYRHGKKKINNNNKINKTNKSHPLSDCDCHTGNPVINRDGFILFSRWISVHHSVTRVLISSIFLMCMRLECTIIKQNKTKRSKVKTILFQSLRHKKRTQSSQSKSDVNHFLRPPGCHIFSTFSMIERFFYQKVIEVENSLAA